MSQFPEDRMFEAVEKHSKGLMKAGIILWVISFLLGLGLAGVVIWGIIMLVLHFT